MPKKSKIKQKTITSTIPYTASSRKMKRNIVNDISDIAEEFPDECTLTPVF